MVSERAVARPVPAPNTHSCTPGNRTTPVWCQRATRWPICFASLPGRTPGCWCPQINGPVPHAFLGGRAPATASPVEDQMLMSHRSRHPCLVCSAAALHQRRSLSLRWIMRQNRGQTGFLKADAFDCQSALEPELGLCSVPERI